MSIEETIAADQAAVEAAQAALDAANAALAADQAKLEAVQPHLSVLYEIEQYAETLGEEMRAGLTALVAKARGLF